MACVQLVLDYRSLQQLLILQISPQVIIQILPHQIVKHHE
jgi:hypothetical protein